MFYQLYELNHAALAPLRATTEAMRVLYSDPANPVSQTAMGRTLAAGLEVFERMTRRYAKPTFDLPQTVIDGDTVDVTEEIIWSKPFCNLLHFRRDLKQGRAEDPKILLVAPMSGHYATLLRGTVEALLPSAEVYITDWIDARTVPVTEGTFDLDDYIDYVIEMLQVVGPKTNVVAVCQPSVPVLSAVALMEAAGDVLAPASITLMGGPIDTRINPTAVNAMAKDRPLSWFKDNVIMSVPWPQPGCMRPVYPGFLQLSGFMSMNLDRHVTAHKEFFEQLVQNDGESAERHREFYDEYLAVMDLTAEFYLQTVDTVFIRHALPKGEMMHRDRPVDTAAIRNVALLTVEGENDDISGLGQTEASHTICPNIPDAKRMHYVQPDVGHYGVFNGSRFRKEIAPRIIAFARAHSLTGEGQGTQKPASRRKSS
ncbi:poly(3-hydroxybutyrate) depolymerase [Neorhizobium huautlense]|uniref:Poly(3-hydroxybutyrate) depolymerase n=1 Tax=Neorhizobium huautlense TaxID=67774 RepID=A0ABT9PYG3_9HYPH|nr:polyhydroxyalkanoate depolymerase [Neorhizobium huautlense]MDP9839270.1 poly(3-hydroxybutyrate) depolymerase [Neorhizobium huautlense]